MFTRMRRWAASRRRSDDAYDRRQHLDGTDAGAQVSQVVNISGNNVPMGGGMPPDYVKSYDEGRPRK